METAPEEHEWKAELVKSGRRISKLVNRVNVLLSQRDDLLAALLWLKPYAEIQVKRYPDGEDIGGWRMVLAAIERATP